MMEVVAPVLLRLPDVERMVGFKRATIYKWMKEGRFPRHIPLGGRMVAWLTSEVQDWIDAKVAAHDSLAA